MNRHMISLKKKRRLERLTSKQQYEAAELAVTSIMAVSMYSAKAVFKERATNPKMELFARHMLYTWRAIADGKVTLETIADSIETECKIRYDIATGDIINLKGV